ncbi:N-acetylmuramoyl-L-alanine amidase [Tabrizicola piscis]|uniref:N-acetylmuramoyl-L-alanine amidase n=1 Tax=Tabrizicola piscis TaxID=2494374 RepID=A0A3S8UBD4_9RHOB|nr:N-acetylmuramoyl-L-alanine amidase [Tabrizicola piscis]AZL60871.1 N-acetylmuramoyl-L-alanine amidase [Tabrizicola piscis]
MRIPGLSFLVRLALLCLTLTGPAAAQTLSALARLEVEGSTVTRKAAGLELRLAVSQPVPWRLRFADGPPRLILDARTIDWTGLNRLPLRDPVVAMRAGSFRPGWSRLVVELAGPQQVVASEMVTGEGGTVIRVVLAPTDAESFATEAARPDLPEWAAPDPAEIMAPLPEGAGPIVVVLDPGHGGIDPGAERDGQTEAALMLTFARELKEVLLRDGRFAVVMTRDDDVFVPLETRTSIAREAGADIFLSLHADALAEGEAQGATVYTLDEQATDAASTALAERHDRDDLLAGVDLTDQDDVVAEVLMDMARTETQPRTDRLASAIVGAIKAAEIRMHRRPSQSGSFSVLKSPDIPSVLLELGFLSSERDYTRLIDPDWRAKMAEAIRVALVAWDAEEAAIRNLSED